MHTEKTKGGCVQIPVLMPPADPARAYRVFVSNSVGCESSTSEGDRVTQYLALNGHTIAETPEGADYIVFNTCAFTQAQRRWIVERMDSCTQQSPAAQMVFIGCAREIAPGLLESHPTSLVCGHSDLERLDSIFYRFVPFQQTPPYSWSKSFQRTVISVGRGCGYECSFCSIKKSIGFIKSRPVDVIVTDFRANLAAGRTRFLLASDDLGSYGKDVHSGLPGLLEAIDRIGGDFSVLLSNIHPRDFLRDFEAIAAFMASPRASKWLFLPIQSGSQQVLASMRRSYSMAEIGQRMDELSRRVPGLRFYYDVIVGYPTETDEAFEDTLRFVRDHPPACLNVMQFSFETGLEAARLPRVPHEVVKERIKWLRYIWRDACSLKRILQASWGQELPGTQAHTSTAAQPGSLVEITL